MCNLSGQLDEKTFRSLTGNSPFPWQRRLYEKWVLGNFPQSCDLPTGSGKTSVVALWLIALAENPKIPKRLVYVVNRRTVVDQTTDEVEKMAEKLAKADRRELSNLCANLSCLSAIDFPEKEVPLAISTLRGQRADNRAWSADPCRPAVIIGTVDMIGSRLLFGGYRIGFKSRPLHAGFLGQDALLIHDEAHLEPAFQTLAKAIVQQQKEDSQNADAACQLNLVSLTATPRENAKSFQLESDDNNHRILSQRLRASKNLRLHRIDDPKQLREKIVEKSLKHKDCREPILIYARKVDDVEKIVEDLKSKLSKERVLSLTGTMRGLERDNLTQNPIFQRFFPEKNKTNDRVSSAENNQMAFSELSSATESEVDKSQSNSKETVYLVCTSAGEVGINLSAKHLVCDLSAFESMAQRFGRVNRFGEHEQSHIDVVYPDPIEEGKSDYDAALNKTLKILKSLKKKQQHPENLYDASPHSLREALRKIPAEERKDAFSPEPEILPTSDILFDAWTMTTIQDELPGRPPLSPYLHGVLEGDPPQTTVAWREEVERITGDLIQEHPPKDLLEAFPLKPHELLSDHSDRVFKRLQTIAKRFPDKPVWLIDEQNRVEVLKMKELIPNKEKGEKAKEKMKRIQYKTVLLSPEVRGLRKGLLSSEKTEAPDPTSPDVSCEWKDENGQPRRKRCYSRGDVPTGWRLVRTINLSQSEDDEVETDEEESSDRKIWYWCENPRNGDGEGYTSAKEKVSLENHTNAVVQIAEAFAKRLNLDPEIARSLKLAARWHDLGKKRKLWQRSIGNPEYPQKCLAKSGCGMMQIHLGHYRHELGSLIDATKDATNDPEFAALSQNAKDLTLHLIAAHHGRGRPHFPQKEVSDPDNPLPKAEKIADEVPLRFERLQRRYGRWGLAYLESLLRAADYAASAGLTAKKETAK